MGIENLTDEIVLQWVQALEDELMDVSEKEFSSLTTEWEGESIHITFARGAGAGVLRYLSEQVAEQPLDQIKRIVQSLDQKGRRMFDVD